MRRLLRTCACEGFPAPRLQAKLALALGAWAGGHGVLRPTGLKAAMGGFAHQFANSRQRDAHGLVTFVLDRLHEDLNAID
jgi:ubiquitin C-terminal hydrolase